MTTGTYHTGIWNPSIDKFHSSKSWSGADGRYIPDSIGPQTQWNVYNMVHGKIRSSNSNRLGYSYAGGPTQEVENHSWEQGPGSDPGTIGYRPPLNAGSDFPLAFPNDLFNEFWTSREEYTLLNRLLKKVKGHELNLGVSLAEVDKLAGTILGTVKTLVFGLEDLAKGNFARFARRFGASPPTRDVVRALRLRDISGRFLEMRYAWTPAIQDAFEAAKAFEALSDGPRKATFHKSYRVGRQRKYNTNYCIGIPQAITISKSYVFEMYEEMDAFRSMGLTNPATILWERLPWSFVVDWFIPVGNYLDLIGQVPYMKGRWCMTRSIKWQVSGSFGFGPITPLHVARPPYADCNWEVISLERSPIANPGVMYPNFEVAGAVHGKRVGNAIALAQQLFSKAFDSYTRGATWY